MLEAVLNVSEGRRPAVLDRLAAAAGDDLLDLHVDPWHHRAVLTLLGEDAARRVTTAAIGTIDLRRHRGVHPRLGAVDVVPFVPLAGSTLADAVAARERYVAWSPVPCARYGVDAPSLPQVRRRLQGAPGAHPTAGITCVGARAVLVAYNLWLEGASERTARGIAEEVRGPAVRALGLTVGDGVQVSMNLLEPAVVGPADVYDLVAARAPVASAELVGLVPRSVLDAVPAERWEQLDLSPERTIEARVDRSGAEERGAGPRSL